MSPAVLNRLNLSVDKLQEVRKQYWLTRENNLIRRDIDVLTESLAFFVRLYLTFNAHTPIPDKATQAVAQERYQKFVEQVGRQIAGGKRSLGPRDGEEIP